MKKKEKKEKENVEETFKTEKRLTFFLRRNRTILIVVLCVVVAAVIVGTVATNAHQKRLQRDFYQIDQLETTYTSIEAMDKKAADYASQYAKLQSDLTELAKGRNYPALKAKLLLATLAYEEKDYQKAIDGFMAVYDDAKGNYLAPIALIDAAVAAEDNGDDAKALEYYTKVWNDFGVDCPESPKALFNQARLQQKSGNAKLAKATFQQLVDQFPKSEYAKLAQSVVLTL